MAPKKRWTVGLVLSSVWLGMCAVSAIFGDFFPIPAWDDYNYEASGVPIFSPGHLLGTDFDGSDILAGIVHGARTSLGIALTAVVFGSLIGGLLGIIAAYRRGWIDAVVTMYFNVALSIPTLVLTLVMVAMFSSPNIDDPSSALPREVVIVIALTLVLIPILGRIARSSALSWTGRDFVLVAESIGMTRRSILWSHILPNVLPAMMSVAFLAAGVVIVVEGGLAILGAGADPGASWGSMLAKNRQDLAELPAATIIPVVAIALTVMALNYFGDYVRLQIDNRESRI
ncbi:MAG: ABC transporter permease [Ilumatobacteraceae bacterium]